MEIIVVVLLVVFVVIGVLMNNANEKQKEKREERAAAHKLQVQKQQEEFKQQIDELKHQYGNCTLDVYIDYFQEYVLANHVFIFEESKILYVANEPIPFEKILCFELKDNQSTITKTTSPKYKTSTNTGSMLGRAIVGGVLTGGVGAVVGAATAKKTTKVVEEGKTTTTVKHNYRITLTIDDMANPVRVIDCKYHQDKAEQIANVLNIIMHRNQETVLND